MTEPTPQTEGQAVGQSWDDLVAALPAGWTVESIDNTEEGWVVTIGNGTDDHLHSDPSPDASAALSNVASKAVI
jgi:hypothetical protein